MNRRKLIRNVSAVSLGAVALALCSLPQNRESGTKRMPMPSPQEHSGKKARDIAAADIPRPSFGDDAPARPAPAPTPGRAVSIANDTDHTDRIDGQGTRQTRPAEDREPATAAPAGEPAEPKALPDSGLNDPDASTAPNVGGVMVKSAVETPAVAAPPIVLAGNLEPLAQQTAGEFDTAFAEFVPLGEPAGSLADRSKVRIWDFATGIPLTPVDPVHKALESNDNGPVAGEEAAPAEASDLAVVPDQVSDDSPAADPAADAASTPLAVPAPSPEPAQPAAAEKVQERAQVSVEKSAPDGLAVTEIAAPQSVALVDAGADADTGAETAEAPGTTASAASAARVWDFATGKPIAPLDSMADVAAAEVKVSAPPNWQDNEAAMAGAHVETPPNEPVKTQAEGQVEAQSEARGEALTPTGDRPGVSTQPQTGARVWDFRTGEPLAGSAALLQTDTVSSDLTQLVPPPRATGQASSPAYSAEAPVLGPQDELILEVKIKGIDATDTIIAYGTRSGIYLPLGAMARILDLAITVSDDGNYAHGWILDEDRILAIDLRQKLVEFETAQRPLKGSQAVAFEGEMYLQIEQFAEFLPIRIAADLRSMSVEIETLQPFPFQLRAEREANRKRMEARQGGREARDFERVDLPWQALSVPAADVELRAVSDSIFGPRLEGDLRLAGDLGFLTAEAYLSGETENGLTASLLELGRVDPDGDLLGPLSATAFSVGDIATESMPLGLRSVSGRGFAVTNAATQTTSVFDRVDLRGILPDGYEVELYRNDILIGSTRETVNGQFEFLQVPVDFGLNVFRLVFFGPQGQRSESVRRISVGDGRVSEGQLVYNFGAAQRDQNLLGVTPPNFVPSREFGNWRASGQLAYGVSSDLTAVLSGAWFERDGDHWVSSAGMRTSLGGAAVKLDAGFADGGALAFEGGIGGRIGRSAITLSHTEYSGLFPDETKAPGLQFLRRATELDFNTTVELGNPVTGLVIPLSARVRNFQDVNGRSTFQAGMRASTRTSGLLLSNTLDYSRTSSPDFQNNAQLFGNFDLATLGRSNTRARFSLGYQVHPQLDITNAGAEINHTLDDRTALRASANYDFSSHSPFFSLSAVRDFDRFSLAFDSNYSFSNDSYYVGLRLGLSLGRDPMSKRVFAARPGQATSGGATLRAFQDLNGDGTYGPTDRLLPEVDFVVFNKTASTNEAGIARIGGLGTGREVGIQIDPASLPDITLAPAKPGVEVVPRAGRLHAIDYPVVALSEIEGTASFVSNGVAKGVSGVRLTLSEENGKIVGIVKTELDGYYFFERVMPGSYRLSIDPAQAGRLNLCPLDFGTITVGYESDVIARDIEIKSCEAPQPRIVKQEGVMQPGTQAELAAVSH